MKIAESSLTLTSSFSQTQQYQVSESLRTWVDVPARPAAPQSTVSLSDAGRQAASVSDSPQGTDAPPELLLIKQMIEILTGQKIHIYSGAGLAQASAGAAAGGSATPAAPRAGYGLDYTHQETYSESQQMHMSASGVVKTADGKEIKFDLNLDMQYQYSETSSTHIQMGDKAPKTDPLVINFNGTAAQLSDQRFSFDLNSDGKGESINLLQSGSGYLALDKNGDGKVNNGSELFGTASGNGFADLAKLDSDKNGWIDESDPAFKQLMVWLKDSSGKDQLASLASMGVGALAVGQVATPFDLKNSHNQELGSIRASGVYLNENGSVGTLQQVDLTV